MCVARRAKTVILKFTTLCLEPAYELIAVIVCVGEGRGAPGGGGAEDSKYGN